MSARTPWGAADSVTQVAPGIQFVTTPSHGGYLLNANALAEMPAVLRAIPPFAGLGAYEEDCDWAIVCLAFPQHFPARALVDALMMARIEWWKPHAAVSAWLRTAEGQALTQRAEAVS